MSKELPCTQVMGWMFVNNKVFVHNEPTRKVAAPECTPPVYQQIELIYMYRKVLLSALEHKCQRNRLIRFLLRPWYKEENQTIFSPSGCWTPNIEWQILMQSDKSQCLRAQYIYHLFVTQRRSGPPVQSWNSAFGANLCFRAENQINKYLSSASCVSSTGENARKYDTIPALSWLARARCCKREKPRNRWF